MNTNDRNDFDPAIYAANLADAIIQRQSVIDDLNQNEDGFNWWQKVIIELHDRLADRFLGDGESGGRYKTELENREAIRAQTTKVGTGRPWASAPPWKVGNPKPPSTPHPLDTVHEQECATVDCLDGITDALQSQIDSLNAQLKSLSAAHESLHNTCWKQSIDVGSRLDALEQKTPC